MIDDMKFNLVFLDKAIKFNFGNEYDIFGTNSIQEAKELLESNKFDFVFIDYHIESKTESGIELAKFIDANFPDLRYCYLSSCQKSNIAGAKIETNLGKVFNKEFFERLKNELHKR